MRALLIALLLSVGGWAINCEKNPNYPRCPAQIQKAKGTDPYCAVFARGKGADSAGVFLQAFPASFCDEANQTETEKDKFLFVLITGGQWMANADSTGAGFELELSASDKAQLKQSGRKIYDKPVVLKKKLKNFKKGDKK